MPALDPPDPISQVKLFGPPESTPRIVRHGGAFWIRTFETMVLVGNDFDEAKRQLAAARAKYRSKRK
ncbi:MAG: hypothetical protein DCC71_12140 [Proteobacteria bacterium]|nr:MAG: hypothetical protein DCC71_12140 [Pseudomonadota bacterium]